MTRMIDIRERTELLKEVADYFWNQWGSDSNYNFYRDCIERSCDTVYVEPEHRGHNVGMQLQNHAINQAKLKGYEKLYLCTDLTDYYEKNNWKFIGKGYSITDEETRIYEFNIESS
jgi:GNAT superfamily N-acetyltransferase